MLEQCRYLDRTYRVDPHLYCHMHIQKDAEFIATDNGDWYGVLTAQWPTIPSPESAANVDRLLRIVGDGKSPILFRYEVHESNGIIRAVYRLPLFTDFFGEEDVEDAVWTMYQEWTTISPFIQRVIDGESVDLVARDAVPAMEKMRQEP
jgi:hypothetical protein